MSDPYEPPRPRDDALESELESLHQQEEEGHATPKEQRRAEQRTGCRWTSTARKCGTGARRTASWIVRRRKSAIVTATDLPPGPAQLFGVTQKRTS
jgi:hypothetical protein